MRNSVSISSAVLSVTAAIALSGCIVAARIPGPVLYVDRAPPVAYNEAILVSPGPGYVWINGYHSWTGREYYWNRGHWTLPVRGYSHWNQGYWHRDQRGHYWVPGHWR